HHRSRRKSDSIHIQLPQRRGSSLDHYQNNLSYTMGLNLFLHIAQPWLRSHSVLLPSLYADRCSRFWTTNPKHSVYLHQRSRGPGSQCECTDFQWYLVDRSGKRTIGTRRIGFGRVFAVDRSEE